MDDFINLLVAVAAAFALGMAFHSTGLHEGYLQRVREWLEKLI